MFAIRNRGRLEASRILEARLTKLTGTILLLICMAGLAFAGPVRTPEIDPTYKFDPDKITLRFLFANRNRPPQQ